MLKIKTFVIIIIIYVIAFISLKTNINLFYPFYLLKDLVFLPVDAIKTEVELSNQVYEGIVIEQQKEFEELKKINNLSSTLTEFDSVTSLVITRNKMYWFNTLTINSGSKDGISEDMAVISSDGLVGRITKVSLKTSEVKLITTSDINHKISVMIKSNDDTIYGILSGYNKEKECLEVTSINKINEIEKNSLVYTSGMGGIFPSGILIGSVEEIVEDKYNVSKVIYIKPSSNFNDLKFVKVLKRK